MYVLPHSDGRRVQSLILSLLDGELPGTYGAMKKELENPMKRALDNDTVVDATVVEEWAKSAKQLIKAAVQDTQP